MAGRNQTALVSGISMLNDSPEAQRDVHDVLFARSWDQHGLATRGRIVIGVLLMDVTLDWTSDNEFVIAGTAYACFDLENPESGSTLKPLRILKPRWELQRYEQIIRAASPKRVFELGIWGGGSTAFLAQLARPITLVAVDIMPAPCAMLEAFIETHGLRDSLATYYGVDQADTKRLSEIVEREFGNEPLDLVVDDASHLVDETRSSFNVLFPRLAPGGQYLIEDWCWAHNDASSDIKRFRGKTPLSVLLFELMLVCAHRPMLIEEVVIKKGLAIVRRGPEEIDPTSFDVSTSFGDAGQALVRNLRGA